MESVMFHSRVGKAFLIFLGILPAAFLLADIYFFAVNVPFMDDWQFVPLLEKAKEGTLSFYDLWAPHDEHRLLLPRILIIASMFASGGDYRVQCFITFSVVALISLCLLWLMVRLDGSRSSVLWAWVLANIALFSPIQYHNWLWPMQFAYFLPYTFLALCLCALYARIPPVPKFILAAALALAGNFSFVQGNLIWPALLPVILFAPDVLAKGARRNFAIAWGVLGALAVTLYFWGLEHNTAIPDYAYDHKGVPPTMSTLRLLQEQPVHTLSRMGRFVLAMFGNSVARGFPVADNLIFAYICGAIVLALAVLALAVAWKRRVFLDQALPWACLLLFSFVTAAFVCVGRVWRGDDQPLTPRYATFGTFCIVALIALFSAVFFGREHSVEESGRTSSPWDKMISSTPALLVGFFLCVQSVNWIYGHNLMEEWSLTRWHALARLHFLGKIPTYARPDLLGGTDEIIREMASSLEKLGMLNPPRANDLRISALGKEVEPQGIKKGRMNQLIMRGPKGWRASGNAFAMKGRSADAVILGVQNDKGEWVAITAGTPLSRPNYLRWSNRMDWEFLALSPSGKGGDWEIELPLETFGDLRSGVLRAWAMDYRRRVLYRLPGDQNFIVIYKNNPSLKGSDDEAAGTQL
jgi:hypothetical protein